MSTLANALQSTSLLISEVMCPGHDKFFHHYSIYDKAKRKSDEEVQNLIKQDGIASACYRVIHKDSTEGKEAGFFNMLNSIYKYAVVHNYVHVQGRIDLCPEMKQQYVQLLQNNPDRARNEFAGLCDLLINTVEKAM